ncbi:hypothetical protein SAMN05421813_1098 [Daejeonella rubra]|uniref:Outer membrane protein beta-barrel domain-containing protein n=1 Tax=Daejeonella rubra TaxID=990371 RepID=A0A1G9RZG1_9SPHI|nr:hypothetical protein [Daejeonella rubra]SDM28678.1 hypothetical protein SAMN05421813_1098 [Daejeonella rubra]
MKSLCKLVILTTFFSLSNNVNAQDYKTSLGLGIDFGTGSTMVGPSAKYFFTKNSAIQGDVLFGGNSTLIQAFYQHHFPVIGAPTLNFIVGGGAGIELYNYGSTVLLKPTAGLEYKIKEAPLAFNFDWRPTMFLLDGAIEPARFGIGIKYTF